MQNYKQKLEEIIYSSSLSREQKLLWQLFLKVSRPEENEAVYEAITEEEGNLPMLTTHLSDKIFDMGKDNKKVWDIISKDEKKFAEFMSEYC